MFRIAIAVTVLVVATGRALAHGSQSSGHGHWLGPLALSFGAVVLVGSVWLDRNDRIEPRFATVGLLAGLVTIVVGIVAVF